MTGLQQRYCVFTFQILNKIAIINILISVIKIEYEAGHNHTYYICNTHDQQCIGYSCSALHVLSISPLDCTIELAPPVDSFLYEVL